MRITSSVSRCAGFLWRAVRWLAKPVVVAVILAILLADAYLETTGLPAAAVEVIRAQLAQRGILADMDGVRAGLLQGITIEQLTVYDASRSCALMFEADEVRLRLHRSQFVRGHIRPRAVEVRNLVVHRPFVTDAAAGTAALPIARLNGSFRIRRDAIQVSSVTGDIAGLRVQLRGRVEHLRAAAAARTTDTPNAASQAGGFGWSTILAAVGGESHGKLENYLRTMVRDGLPQGDGWLDARFRIPLDAPEDSTVWGSLSVADAAIRGVDVRKFRSHFLLRGKHLRLDQLDVHVIGDQRATAEVDVDLASRQISGRAQGILNPEVALHLLGYAAPRFIAEIRLAEPLTFAATLRPSPWDFRKAAGDVRFTTGKVWYRDLDADAAEGQVVFSPEQGLSGTAVLSGVGYKKRRVRELRGSAQVEGDVVRITKLDALLDADGREKLSGNVTLFLKTQEIAFEATGAVLPATLAHPWPGVPPAVLELFRETTFPDAPPEFSGRLERSPYDPAQWTGTASIRFGAGMCRELRLGGGHADLTLAKGVLGLRQQITFGEKNAEELELAADINLGTERISGRVSGKLYVDRTYQAIRLPPHFLIERLSQSGAPAAVSAELAESPLPPESWQATGRIVATDTAYDGLMFRKGEADVRLRPGTLLFSGMTAETKAGDSLEGDIEISLPSGDIELRAVINGDPRLIRAFIAPGRSREVFDRIWRDFAWDPQSPPRSDIRSLKYVSSSGSHSYHFTMECGLEARNAVWSGLQTDLLKADISLNLPKTVAIKNCELRSGSCHVTGDVLLDYADMSLCQFRLQGVSDPRLVLLMISPTWPELLGNARFPDNTEIACQGSFYLGPDARPRLHGTLKSPTFAYGQYKLEDFFAKWQLDGNRVDLAPLLARAHGGRVFGTGQYDFSLDSGQLQLTVEKVGLSPLLGQGKTVHGVASPGNLSGSCTLELLRPFPENPLQVTGSGRLWVEGADLWRFPILSQLGKMVGFAGLGRISRLDADLTFVGEHVLVPEFHTDGTLLALGGSGDYGWVTDTLEFKVRGEALKRTRIIPFLLRPLFWMFEAELVGSVKEPRWRLTRGLSRIFSD